MGSKTHPGSEEIIGDCKKGKGSLEKMISQVHISEKSPRKDSEASESDSDSDFVPVGFDYDEFNKKAAGIIQVDKPRGGGEERQEKDILNYYMLLDRIDKHLRPSDGETESRLKIPISIRKEGSTKTTLNITDICETINREINHLKHYLEVELSATCSVDGEGRLVIKGVFLEAQVQKIIRNYIKQYVTCGICSSLNTAFEKEGKILFKHCKTCGASQSVNAVAHGFKALTTKRSVLRRKAEE
jgi:translation initiation factor 2 subunit 2